MHPRQVGIWLLCEPSVGRNKATLLGLFSSAAGLPILSPHPEIGADGAQAPPSQDFTHVVFWLKPAGQFPQRARKAKRQQATGRLFAWNGGKDAPCPSARPGTQVRAVYSFAAKRKRKNC